MRTTLLARLGYPWCLAIAVAGVLTAGAVQADAASITCGFVTEGTGPGCALISDDGGANGGFTVGGNAARYSFDPDEDFFADYFLDIIFDHVLEEFNLTVTNVHRTPEAMAAKLATNFPGYVCVPIFPGSCVEFLMVPDNPNGWEQEGPRGPGAEAGYTMTISWFAATDPPFDDPSILKYDGDDLDGGIYDLDITIPGSYFNGNPPCFPPGECPIDIEFHSSADDPGIGGRDIAFSVNTVAQQVPEPASLALMGLGLAAVAYVARRRRHSAR